MPAHRGGPVFGDEAEVLEGGVVFGEGGPLLGAEDGLDEAGNAVLLEGLEGGEWDAFGVGDEGELVAVGELDDEGLEVLLGFGGGGGAPLGEVGAVFLCQCLLRIGCQGLSRRWPAGAPARAERSRVSLRRG